MTEVEECQNHKCAYLIRAENKCAKEYIKLNKDGNCDSGYDIS